MASTYSNLKIQLMATGENSGTWGNVTNVNLGTALEEAIAGSADVTFSSGNVTLTLTDTNASQTARNMRLNLTGTTGGARDLIVPAVEKMYLVNNGCADAVTIKVSGQTGIAVPAGKTMLVYNNGTDVVDAVTHLSSLTLGTDLAVAQGGTGASDAATARTNLGLAIGTDVLAPNGSGASLTSLNASSISSGTLSADRLDTVTVSKGGTGQTTLTSGAVLTGNGTSAISSVSAGTSGNVLTSNGSAWVSQAISAGGDYIARTYSGPSSGTWTKPAGLKAIRVTVTGGTGGGGSGGNTPETPGGAGAGGGFASEYIPAPSIPGPQPYTVGGGGSGGSPFQRPGNTGGTSSFGSYLSATGGSGGGSDGPRVGGTGGSGSGGDVNGQGAPGIPANVVVAGIGGMTAGFGGLGGTGSTGASGSPGVPGYVLVEEYY